MPAKAAPRRPQPPADWRAADPAAVVIADAIAVGAPDHVVQLLRRMLGPDAEAAAEQPKENRASEK